VDVGRAIPPELYQAVAEILAFVYRIKNNSKYYSADQTVATTDRSVV